MAIQNKIDITDSSKANINFLVYDNRSGSTYLSALLAGFPEIGVTLESPFLFYLLTSKEKYYTESEIDRSLRRIYSDPKFNEWDVPRHDLRKRLLDNLPLSKKDFICFIFAAYFDHNKPQSRCWIYKGCSPHWIKKLREIFPESKFIFIYRDGRGVFCSKKRSINPYTGNIMEKDPIRAARMWSTYNKIINNLHFQDQIIKIKYEDLIMNVERELKKLYHYLLGGQNFPVGYSISSRSYYAQIPIKQTPLHPNVCMKPSKSRIDAWKDEITYAEAYLYEKTANKILSQLGYEIQYINRSRSEIEEREIKSLYMRILSYRCLHYLRRVRFYSSRPMEAVWNLIYKIRTRY